jgi:hypothetical protein
MEEAKNDRASVALKRSNAQAFKRFRAETSSAQVFQCETLERYA